MKVYIDEAMLKNIHRELGMLSGAAPAVLSKVLNNVAKKTRESLLNRAKQRYWIKDRGFEKDVKIKNSTPSTKVAEILSEGHAMGLINFNTTPKHVTKRKKGGKAVKAAVLAKNAPKELTINGFKTFVVKFKNPRGKNKVAVVHRTGKATRRSKLGDSRYIKVVLSPSVPSMIGNEEEVWGKEEPYIESRLQNEMRKELNRILGR